MTTVQTTADPPLPRRLAYFAPWCWWQSVSPWRRWTIAAVAAVAFYFLSAIPTFYAAVRLKLPTTHLTGCVFAPVFWVYANTETGKAFDQFQWNTRVALFGSPFPEVICALPAPDKTTTPPQETPQSESGDAP